MHLEHAMVLPISVGIKGIGGSKGMFINQRLRSDQLAVEESRRIVYPCGDEGVV